MGASPTLPTRLAVIPPVDVAQAMFPWQSMATAPTVSHPLSLEHIKNSVTNYENRKEINFFSS